MKRIILKWLPLIDVCSVVLVYPAAWLLKLVRIAGVHRLPYCRAALMKIGLFPIRNHYYEPQFNFRNPNPAFSEDRNLSGINWNVDGQLGLLKSFRYAGELADLPQQKPDTLRFYFNNGGFESGDAEYWYQIIRALKPRRIVEVGSGYSTLMAIRAVRKNRDEDPSYQCQQVCIEPYEMPWLEQAGVSVVRKKVEEVELSLFSQLQANDLLFIDSSHIIRPQGDVLFEYLELLPALKKGVVVHIHDIFSPKNYPHQWLSDEIRFWNEQYLLEAFLSHNDSWKIVGALNYLHHHHYAELKAVAPYLTPDREPGSFYMQKVG